METIKQNLNVKTVPKKFNLNTALQVCYGKHHRAGWSYALKSLQPLHSDRGIFVDGFIEKKFAWGSDPGDRYNNPYPYREPWVGFIHCPPNMPTWFRFENSPQRIFQTDIWKQSLEYCYGLFCLSKYHKKWLEQYLDIPIINLLHPTAMPNKQFSMTKFLNNPKPKIIQIGWWLRKLHSIYYVPVQKFQKAILLSQEHINDLWEQEKHLFLLKPNYQSVQKIQYLSNNSYDDLLSKNIVYLDLYDSSANNTLVECIARATPVFVNPLPAVTEYLGTEYPLYFRSWEELNQKMNEDALINQAHHYLQELANTKLFSIKFFLQTILNSNIYAYIK